MKKLFALLAFEPTTSQPLHIKLDGSVEDIKLRQTSFFGKVRNALQFVFSFLFSPLP